MAKKIKIEVSENFTSILTYINTCETKIDFADLVQYCIDYDLYKELYVHLPVIELLIQYHNENIENKEDIVI